MKRYTDMEWQHDFARRKSDDSFKQCADQLTRFIKTFIASTEWPKDRIWPASQKGPSDNWTMTDEQCTITDSSGAEIALAIKVADADPILLQLSVEESRDNSYEYTLHCHRLWATLTHDPESIEAACEKIAESIYNSLKTFKPRKR